jgi:M6 family metalloprotease-like protein
MRRIYSGILCMLLAAQALQAQQPDTTLQGTLNIIWNDPHPQLGSGGKALYSLQLANGTTIPLQIPPAQESAAAYYFRKRVLLNGRAVPNQFATTQTRDAAAFAVDAISPDQPQAQAADAVASAVFGTKKVIYLLLEFSDDAAVPHPADFYTDMNNPDTPPAGEPLPGTINGFFKKTSWNQFSWLGDLGGIGGVGAPGGWFTLPQPKSYYAPCGWSSACADLLAIANDGMALGRAAGINFKNYDNINFVLSNDLDCCASGGSFYSSTDNKVYGATWEPPWGQETGVYVHEMGHSIGLPHSGWVYAGYDSPWDMMSSRRSATNLLCGSYISKNSNGLSGLNCTEPGDGYIAPHKDYLGWIPVANMTTTDSTSSITVTIEADAVPLGSAAKILKICISGIACSGGTAHYFTVEARVNGLGSTSQYDNGIVGEGVIIHDFIGNRAPISGACFFNNQSGWAVPIDATPADYDSVNCSSGGRAFPNYGLYNAQWNPGQTYTNATYGFQIRVISRSGSTFVVSLNPSKKRRGQLISN